MQKRGKNYIGLKCLKYAKMLKFGGKNMFKNESSHTWHSQKRKIHNIQRNKSVGLIMAFNILNFSMKL